MERRTHPTTERTTTTKPHVGPSVHVGVRLPVDLAAEIHRLASLEHNGVSAVMRRVLSHGLREIGRD